MRRRCQCFEESLRNGVSLSDPTLKHTQLRRLEVHLEGGARKVAGLESAAACVAAGVTCALRIGHAERAIFTRQPGRHAAIF